MSMAYNTSKAYYQTAFGLRTLYFGLQNNVTVKVPTYFHKLVLIKAFVETVLVRNI